MKDINDMTRKEFESLPHRKWDEEIACDSLIFLPGRAKDLHDSGYRTIDFVAVIETKPSCLISGGSDVMHIDGIGGWGYLWGKIHRGVPKLVPPIGWQIDCLPKSGLFRIFCNGYKIICGCALSSFEFWAVKDQEEQNGGF